MGSRRDFIKDGLAMAGASALGGCATGMRAEGPADTLIVNARAATLDPRQPSAEAIAIKGERIIGVGAESELGYLKDGRTRVIDAGRRTIVPGINDANTHFIRGGLTYTNEVRWDGVTSLAEGMRRVREQARRTPPPHWVQVIGGWTWAQFAEKRLPTLDEINAATGDTPCMVMHLYDRLWVNRAGIRVLGWTRDTPHPFGGRLERDASGNPNGVLVSTVGSVGLLALVGAWLRVPRLAPEEQAISTRYFMREHNRLGVTSIIDAGGGGQNYPDSYLAIAKLAAAGEMPLRVSYQLFPQGPGKELENYTAWSKLVTAGQGNDFYRMLGAGEYLALSSVDVTNFAKDYSDPPPTMRAQLGAVARYVAKLRWPFRQHTSFDLSASRILDVLEEVNQEVALSGLRWGFEHCETLQPKTLERVAKLGGSINIQNRMSLDGEAFVNKYGAQVASDAPPVARIRQMGIPLACGTDANRVTSYNPWIGVHWLITGRTLGGAKLQGDHNLLDRTEALRLYTSGGAWMSSEEEKKGTLEPGKLADLAILSADYFSVPEEQIRDLESVLTMVGGKVVYGAGPYSKLDPPSLPSLPDWLPVQRYGGYSKRAAMDSTLAAIPHHHDHGPLAQGGSWSLECSCGMP